MIDCFDIKASLSISLQTQDLTAYSNELLSSPIKARLIKDTSGCNLFHDLSKSPLKCSHLLNFLKILLQKISSDYPDSYQIQVKQMLNEPASRSKSKATPLYLCVKTNKKEFVKSFIQLGADPYIRYNGRTLAHVASEKGYTYLLVYLCREVKINYKEKDLNGRNALHLAILKGETVTALMLIAWSNYLNETDVQGNTALHLALMANDYKLVRNLLIRGADDRIRNADGLNSRDLAKEKDDQIKRLVFGYRCKCDYGAKGIGNLKNGLQKFVSNLIGLFSRFLLVCFIFYPGLNQSLYFFGTIGLAALEIISFVFICLKDPGFVKKLPGYDLMQLLEIYKSDYICFYCESRKPYKARHCHKCNKCVRNFDHHCLWLHKCIGQGNYKFFLMFLITSSTNCLTSSSALIFLLIRPSYQPKLIQRFFLFNVSYFYLALLFLNFIYLIIILPLILYQFQTLKNNPRVAIQPEENTEIKVNYESIEMSDSGSMFLKSSSDWSGPSFLKLTDV